MTYGLLNLNYDSFIYQRLMRNDFKQLPNPKKYGQYKNNQKSKKRGGTRRKWELIWINYYYLKDIQYILPHNPGKKENIRKNVLIKNGSKNMAATN